MRKAKLKMLLLPVLLVLGALNLAAGNAHGFDNYRFSDSRPLIVPQPQQYQLSGGELALPENFSVQLPSQEVVILEILNQELGKFGIKAELSGGVPFCRFSIADKDVPESPEGYKLEITSKGICVSARGNAGLFYGAQTLANLLANAAEPKLECCVITDYPSFAFRGYAVEYKGLTPGFRRLVKALARLKINTLSFTLEERIPYKVAGFPESKKTIPLKDLQEMTSLCKKYHLNVMPCVQILSHNQWLSRHQDWEKMSEGKPNKRWNSQPCIQNEEARKITLEVLKEHLDIFKSDMLYVCLDEIFLGPFMQCPRCKGQDAVKLLNDYMAYIRQGLRDAGYGHVKLLFCQDCLYTHARWPWGDAFRKASFSPDKDVIVWWDYKTMPDTESMEPFFKEKFPFIASGIPGTPTNVRNLAKIAKEQHGLGVRFSRWYFSNDAILDNLRTNTPESLGGLVQSSEYLWNFREVHHADFTYDGTYEAMRLLHGEKLKNHFAQSADPVPFNSLVNLELSGTCGMFPKLDDRKLAEINRILAEQPEKYQLLTAPGGKYYGLCLRGSKEDKNGRQGAELALGNRSFQAVSLLLTASAPYNINDYLSVQKYGKKRHKGENAALVRFVYQNGKSQVVPLRFRRELTDWNQTFGGYFMRWAVRGEDGNNLFFSFGTTDIVNPHPEEPVKSIIFSSCCLDGIHPVVLAASLRDGNRKFAAARPFNPKKMVKPYMAKKHGLAYLERKTFLDGKTDDVIIHAQAKFQGQLQKEVVDDARYGKVLKITVPPACNTTHAMVRINVSIPFHFVEGMKSASRSCRVYPKSNLSHVREYFRSSPAAKHDGTKRYRSTGVKAGEKDFVVTANTFSEHITEGDIYLKDMPVVQSRRLSFFLKNTQTPTEIYIAEFGTHAEEISLVKPWSRTEERDETL